MSVRLCICIAGHRNLSYSISLRVVSYFLAGFNYVCLAHAGLECGRFFSRPHLRQWMSKALENSRPTVRRSTRTSNSSP